MSADAAMMGTLVTLLQLRDELTPAIANAQKAVKDLERTTAPALSNTSGAFTNLGSSAIAAGAFIGTMAAGAVSALGHLAFDGMKGVADAVIEMNSTLESSTLQFATLMGNSDDAREHVKDLFEFAKKTPFETGPIIQASKMLQTFGGSALNTKETLTLLGDAAAATGAPINELGMWVGRMYASLQAGKPFGESAQRLSELAVMTPQARLQLEAMQKQGKSASEIFGVFQKSLEGFGGAMQLQAGTWSGVVSTFKDSVNMLLADALKPLFEGARDAIGRLNEVLGSDGFQSVVENVASAISGGLNTAMAGAVSLFEGLSHAIGPAYDDLTQLYEVWTSSDWPLLAQSIEGAERAWQNLPPFIKEVTGVLLTGQSGWSAMTTETENAKTAITAIQAVIDHYLIEPIKEAIGALNLIGDALRVAEGEFRSFTAGWSMMTDFLGITKHVPPAVHEMQTAFQGLTTEGLMPMLDLSKGIPANQYELRNALGAVDGQVLHLKGSFKALTDDEQKHIDAIKKLVEAMSGADTIKAARDAVEAYNAMWNQGISIFKMSREQLLALNKTTTEAADTERAWGLAADPVKASLRDMSAILALQLPLINKHKDSLIAAGQSYIPLISYQKEMAENGWPKTIAGLYVAIQATGQIIDKDKEAAEAAAKHAREVDELAASFVQLGNTVGGSIGRMIGSLGQLSQAFIQARKANASYNDGVNAGVGVANALFDSNASTTARWGSAVESASAIAAGAMDVYAATSGHAGKSTQALHGLMAGAKAGAAFGPYGMAIGAVAGAVVGLVRGMDAGRKSVQDFAKSFGGFDAMHLKLQTLGAAGEQMWIKLTQGVAGGDSKAAAAAIAQVQKALEGSNDSLNKMVTSALTGGPKISASMQPFIEDMIRAGQVTEENVNLLLGLPAHGVPALADVEAAAKRYGLTLDDLGPKVDQLKITETANQIVKDWDLISDAGGLTGTAMEKMALSVQPLVESALKLGRELPESMRPVIQSMIDAGLLTDDTGKKLLDLSGIKFAEPIEKSIQKLIDKMTELIAKFDTINGKTYSNTIVTRHKYEDEGSGIGTEAGTWTGGYVTSRGVQHFTAGGMVGSTDTVPAMLTPGEIIINAAQQRNVAAAISTGRVIELRSVIEIDRRVLGEHVDRYLVNEVGAIMKLGRV